MAPLVGLVTVNGRAASAAGRPPRTGPTWRRGSIVGAGHFRPLLPRVSVCGLGKHALPGGVVCTIHAERCYMQGDNTCKRHYLQGNNTCKAALHTRQQYMPGNNTCKATIRARRHYIRGDIRARWRYIQAAVYTSGITYRRHKTQGNSNTCQAALHPRRHYTRGDSSPSKKWYGCPRFVSQRATPRGYPLQKASLWPLVGITLLLILPSFL